MARNGKATKPPEKRVCKAVPPPRLTSHKPEPDASPRFAQPPPPPQAAAKEPSQTAPKGDDSPTARPGTDKEHVSYDELVLDLSQWRADKLAGDSSALLKGILSGEITKIRYGQMRELVKDLFLQGRIMELTQLIGHPNQAISDDAVIAYDGIKSKLPQQSRKQVKS